MHYYPFLYTKKGTGKNAKLAYSGLAKINDYNVFVLYDGRDARRQNYHLQTLYRFDEKLIPTAKYTLSTPIFSFDIDWKRKIIYGLSHEKGSHIILFKYQE